MREFFIANAAYWIDEFHFDGLRIDATQAIRDAATPTSSPRSSRRARAAAGTQARSSSSARTSRRTRAARRSTRRLRLRRAVERRLPAHRARRADRRHRRLLPRLPRHAAGAGRRRSSTASSIRASSTRGSATRAARRRADFAARAFVHFLENHDQVANAGFGDRLADARRSGDAARADRVAAARRRRSRCCSRARRRGSREAVAVLLSTTMPELGKLRARGPRGVPHAVRAARDARGASGAARSVGEGDVRGAASSIPTQRRLDDPSSSCIAICSRCAASVRRSPTAPTCAARARRRAFCLRWSARARRSPAARQPRPHASASRAARAAARTAAEHGWRIAWSSEHPRYGGHGTPEPFTARAPRDPRARAVLCEPDPTRTCAVDPPPVSGEKAPVDP